MTDNAQPTTADLKLAEEIFKRLGYSNAFGQQEEIASLIARHRADSEAALRAEIKRLRNCLRQVVSGLSPLIEHLERNAD